MVAILFRNISRETESSNTTLILNFSRYSSIMAPKMFEVSFKENYAILSMKSGENRLNPKFLEDFHCALDKIERYLILFSWGCRVWSLKSWKYVGVWVLFLLYEGNVARLDSRILDHLFASRWEQKTCKHFFIFSYSVQSTAKYFKPVHPLCHTPNKIFYDNLLLLLSLSP